MAEMNSKTPKKVVTKTAAENKKPAIKKPAAATSSKKPAEKATTKAATSNAVREPGVVKAIVSAKRAETSASKAMTVSDEQRYRMVAEAAYYRAEANHFKSDPLRDWIEAEGDIAALLSGN